MAMHGKSLSPPVSDRPMRWVWFDMGQPLRMVAESLVMSIW